MTMYTPDSMLTPEMGSTHGNEFNGKGSSRAVLPDQPEKIVTTPSPDLAVTRIKLAAEGKVSTNTVFTTGEDLAATSDLSKHSLRSGLSTMTHRVITAAGNLPKTVAEYWKLIRNSPGPKQPMPPGAPHH